VQTAKQTSNYGMKGWSAKDFDKNVKEGYFNQFADNQLLMPHSFKQLEMGNTISSSDINYKALLNGANQNAASIKKAIEDNKVSIVTHWNEHDEAVENKINRAVSEKTTFRKRRYIR